MKVFIAVISIVLGIFSYGICEEAEIGVDVTPVVIVPPDDPNLHLPAILAV